MGRRRKLSIVNHSKNLNPKNVSQNNEESRTTLNSASNQVQSSHNEGTHCGSISIEHVIHESVESHSIASDTEALEEGIYFNIIFIQLCIYILSHTYVFFF